MLAGRVIQALEAGPPQPAIEEAIARVVRLGGEAGGLVLDREGRFGWSHNSPHFSIAYRDSSMPEPRVELRRTPG